MHSICLFIKRRWVIFISVFLILSWIAFNFVRGQKLYYKAEASIIFLGKQGTFVPELEIKRITEKDFLQKISDKIHGFNTENIADNLELELEKQGNLRVAFVSEDPIVSRDIVALVGSVFTEERKKEIEKISQQQQKVLKSFSDGIVKIENNLNLAQKQLRELKQQYLESDQRRKDLKLMIEESKLKQQQLLRVFTDKHPDAISSKSKIDMLESQLDLIPDRSDEYDNLDAAIEREKSELSLKKNEYEQAYNSFKQESSLWRAELEKEVVTPLEPLGTNKRWYYIWGIAASLLAGFIVSVLMELSDNRIHTAEEAEKRLAIPVITEIGKVPLINTVKKNNSLIGKMISYNKANFPTAKKVEQLYTFLKTETFKGETSNKKILVTSADSRAGKSFIACYLALIAAINGEKVLLVDANFYNPALNVIFNLDKNMKGFSDLLRGSISKKESIKNLTDLLLSGTLKLKDKQAPGLDNLKILLSGSRVENPFGLLEFNNLKDLFKELSKDYGMIIIDSPAIKSHPEALNLIPIADSTLLVVRKHKSRYPVLRDVIKRCTSIRARLTGMVLTDV